MAKGFGLASRDYPWRPIKVDIWNMDKVVPRMMHALYMPLLSQPTPIFDQKAMKVINAMAYKEKTAYSQGSR
jgi:hypothetical protein